MKTRIILIALTTICFWGMQSLLAQNPTFEWAKQMGGTSDERGRAIVVDVSGNIYTTGSFEGTVDFDPGVGTANFTAAGSRDIFVQKLDANGGFLWVKQMGSNEIDEGYSIAVDDSGNVYTAGYFYGRVDFDPGPGTANLTSYDDKDIFIQKLDTNGDFLWAVDMGGEVVDDYGISITVDASGNVYTTGRFEGIKVDFNPGGGTTNFSSTGNSDIFIQKLDTNGNFLWAKQMGGTSIDTGRSIAIDAQGNVYTTGEFKARVDFDPGAGTDSLRSAGGTDVYVQKLDTNGNFLWVRQMGGTSGEYSNSIVVDASGNVYTTGSFWGTGDFDPGIGAVNLTPGGESDIFVQKLDTNGNFLWVKQMGGTNRDSGSSIAVDAFGNVYTFGKFEGTVDFDPGTGTANFTSVGKTDIFAQKLDTNGNFLWAKQMGGTFYDFGNSITLDASGNIYTTGSFRVTVDFDPGAGTANLTSFRGYDIFVQKLSQCNSTVPVPEVASLPDLTDECSVAPVAPIANNGCDPITATTTTTFPITDQGTTVVTWTFDDENGNIITQDQNVIIEDLTVPVPDIASLSDVIGGCAINSITAPTATDNCTATITATTTTTFPITVQGTTVVTWTYNDGNGNTVTQDQTVIIGDLTNPVPDMASLSDVTDECSVASVTVPTATDNCTGAITATTTTTFPITDQTITQIVWSYDDGNGNVVTQNQTINWTATDVMTSLSDFTITANNANGSYQWLDCDNNNAPIPGENNQSFTTLLTGNYAVEITENGCVATSECVAIAILGLDETENNIQLTVFPNPSSDIFNIEFEKPIENVVLTITDTQGKIISSTRIQDSIKASIELNEIPGVYLLTIQSKDDKKTIKLIKQ